MAPGSSFLPPGAPFTFERFDQGEDFRTTPGGNLVAPWAGRVVLAPSDPGGFGTHYGLYTPSDGPYAGRTFYIGHAYAHPGHHAAGSAIATVGRGWESWMGNAKGIPGHTEIGFWPPGSMSGGSAVRAAVEGGATSGWKKCTLTWYDPALGGINSSGGVKNPTGLTASGEPYNSSAFTCAAPSSYPFGTQIMFKYRGKTINVKVNDRGGAIVGSHFDLSRAAANALGILGAGKVNAEFAVGSGPTSSAQGNTRPGGDTASSEAALEHAFASWFTDNPDNSGPATVANPGAANMMNVDFKIPGIGTIPFPSIPSPLDVIPDIPNPLDLFKGTSDAISTAADFLKWIAWIFHPRNILRVVEFVTGVTIMGAGLHTAIQSWRGAESSPSQARRVISAGVQATPVGRTLRVARGARAGRSARRAEGRRAEYNRARKRARAGETNRIRSRNAERNTRSRYGDNPPF